MDKVKECLECGKKYNDNYCPICGSSKKVFVSRQHTCRYTQKHKDDFFIGE